MEQRNNLVLQGTETFSRGQLGQPCAGKRRTGAGQRGRAQPFVRQLHHPGIRHAGLLQPERQLERPCAPGHHGGGALPGVRSRGVDKLDELWQVGTGLPPVQRVQPERGRYDLFDGRYRHGSAPGGGTGVQLQVNLSTNNDKVTPAVRLLAAAVRPLAWEKRNGHALNRRLYLPEYCLSAHDPSFGREMDLPLVMAALMNCWGEG